MARVADTLDPALAAKMLASPAFAVEAVAAALEAQTGERSPG